MKLIWLGHSSFRLEIGDQTLLIDPWFTGNPMFEGHDRGAAIAGVTAILVSHAHGDHAGDAVPLAQELGIPVAGIYDLMTHWQGASGIDVIGFNKGGTIRLGDVAVTMVHATHSSSFAGKDGPVYGGAEAGFMIAAGGRTVYFSGDTDVMADMKVMQDLHQPEIGILCIGGHFTMDQNRAAYAARTFFDFKTIVPCHYKTFPLLAQDAEVLKAGVPGVDVREPQVMEPMAL